MPNQIRGLIATFLIPKGYFYMNERTNLIQKLEAADASPIIFVDENSKTQTVTEV